MRTILGRAVKRNKYGAKTLDTKLGFFHSRKEAAYGMELEMLTKAKKIRGYKRQVRVPLRVNGTHIANYYVDFVIDHLDGSEEYAEVKGYETREWLLKARLFKALYPERRYSVIR